MNKSIEKNNWRQLEEMWFWRRMLKVQWTDKITNEDTLKQVNEERKTIKEYGRNNQDSWDTFLEKES
jgi:hypothetical protein